MDKIKEIRVSPAAATVALVVALVLILWVGYKSYLAPPRQVHGYANGREMTDADVKNFVAGFTAGIKQHVKEQEAAKAGH